MKKIVTVIGARPQIIKASAISRAIQHQFQHQLKEVIVHTGQHYDSNMSELFFDELQIPKPAYNLNTGSGTHGVQTAKMLEGLEGIFEQEQPHAVLVYGDTNSTLAGALAAVKLHIPVIHVEAGLRSFNKSMPEEINRITSDHMSTLLFTPTTAGLTNLKEEGFCLESHGPVSLDAPAVYHCGDIMYDNSLYFSAVSDERSTILSRYALTKEQFILCTIHRDSNTDRPENLMSIFKALLEIQKQSGQKIILPLHPRTKTKLNTNNEEEVYRAFMNNPAIILIEPVGFLDVIALEKNASVVITDSGGLQKEAYFFKRPCIILRPQTEWIEIVENGNAILADADTGKIVDAFHSLTQKTDFSFPELYGDGNAARFICEKIITDL
ncbi:MAG: UDP-N-acetylglucosamine 2-epimerase (non-hydrolyzing) [Crocinitomicaceae bacterium]|nr:UDP-N-acetylglucosamine 2-epimerase (non-hydrolyzing) [Crocinitomicaceae bacterium]